jgi:hypothetical protein
MRCVSCSHPPAIRKKLFAHEFQRIMHATQREWAPSYIVAYTLCRFPRNPSWFYFAKYIIIGVSRCVRYAAINFINALSEISEAANHHPDFQLTGYRYVNNTVVQQLVTVGVKPFPCCISSEH